LILRAALLAALVACASCPRPPDDSAHTLRVAVEQMPGTLDPRWATDAQAVRILDAVLRGLVHTEYDGRPRLDLAERIDPISETTLRVTLRAGQRFHDGVTIDAQVVAATLRTLADPKTGSPHAAALAGLPGQRRRWRQPSSYPSSIHSI
jgi:peptide/nickel transport system substrate-binding protein